MSQQLLSSGNRFALASEGVTTISRGWRERELLILFLFVILIVTAIISRRPDCITRPQFWAEDGAVWFANAYNLGSVHSLTLPQNGDFQTFPRLAAAGALLAPLSFAPFSMNLLAIIVQALPPVFFLTRRFEHLASIPTRALMAFLLLAIPTSYEVHANVTNSMTFLALLAFLVIIAEPPNTTAWRIFDVVVICLSAATGPFVVFLLPIAVVMYWFRRRPWIGILMKIEFCAALVQGTAILVTAGVLRSAAPRGATLTLLLRIFSVQLIVHPLFGMDSFVLHPAHANSVCMVAFVLAILLVSYVSLKGPLELRLFLLFAGLLFAAALWSPQASLTQPQWEVLILPGCGGRYWLIPVAALSCCYVWMLGRKRPMIVRLVGAGAIVLASWTGIMAWRYPAFADLNFREYVREFEQAPSGKDFAIPINPGDGWRMTLHKH